jgi:hypothetical protein
MTIKEIQLSLLPQSKRWWQFGGREEPFRLDKKKMFFESTLETVKSLTLNVPCPNELLQCYFHGFFAQDDNVIHIVCAHGECCDMGGAIALARMLNARPQLSCICMWSGETPEVFYRRRLSSKMNGKDLWFSQRIITNKRQELEGKRGVLIYESDDPEEEQEEEDQD